MQNPSVTWIPRKEKHFYKKGLTVTGWAATWKNILEVNKNLEKMEKGINQLEFLCFGDKKKIAIKYELPKRKKKEGEKRSL